MQAILPKSLEAKTLGDVPIGQSVWTVPWALQVDSVGRVWVNTCSTWNWRDNNRGGTFQLLLHRVEAGWLATLYDEGEFAFVRQDKLRCNEPVFKLDVR